MSGDKKQDIDLMNYLENCAKQLPDVQVVRVHERNMTIAFPDGRVVTLVLYGPRGK